MVDDIAVTSGSSVQIAEAPNPASSVVIKFKPMEPVVIEIDRSALTWDEFMEFQKLQGLNEEEALGRFKVLLGKLTGLDIGKLPAYQVSEIIKSFSTMVSGEELKN